MISALELSVLLLPFVTLLVPLDMFDFLVSNAAGQLAIFAPIVLLPALATGHMAYVDIGWPAGLTLLGAKCLFTSVGHWPRRLLMGGALMLHGGRMLLGAVVMFFPFRWEADLPRYQYAKQRYLRKPGRSEAGWPTKMAIEIIAQLLANVSALASPAVLAACDPTPQLNWLEIVGYAAWLASWALEGLADTQKIAFQRRQQRLKAEGKKAATTPPVLGHPPHGGADYWLWARCRHPNYFFEWAAWVSLSIAAAPCLLRLPMTTTARLGLACALYAAPRLMYASLMYWTGAEPAEAFSVVRRPQYADYQARTRVFWPFELPLVDHGRMRGWPRGADALAGGAQSGAPAPAARPAAASARAAHSPARSGGRKVR